MYYEGIFVWIRFFLFCFDANNVRRWLNSILVGLNAFSVLREIPISLIFCSLSCIFRLSLSNSNLSFTYFWEPQQLKRTKNNLKGYPIFSYRLYIKILVQSWLKWGEGRIIHFIFQGFFWFSSLRFLLA